MMQRSISFVKLHQVPPQLQNPVIFFRQRSFNQYVEDNNYRNSFYYELQLCSSMMQASLNLLRLRNSPLQGKVLRKRSTSYSSY